MSFKSRLVVFTTVWFCLAMAAIALTYNWQKETIELRTKQSLHQDLASHMRDDNPLMIGTNYNPKALKSIFHTLMLIGPDFEIYFLDGQGNITTHAAPEGTELMGAVNLVPIRQFLSGEPFPILGDDPRNRDEHKVFSVAAIEELGSTIGYLYVVIGSSRHTAIANAQVDSPYLALAGLVLISILGFAFGSYFLVKRSLLNPIERVTDQLQKQAEHDFRLQPDFAHQVPELVPIARSYQLMAKHIQQQFLQLEYQSSHRRQSLLQLSHDLKTPLSSVLGYLETWRLQHPDPDPLIEVAFRNSEKLSQQLHALLDVAKQEAPLPSYEYLPIDISQLMAECAETMQSQFQRKGVTLNITVDEPLQAIGDKGLLERLILNLLENALRHSPSDATVSCDAKRGDNTSQVRFTFSNQIELNAQAGALGIGTKIVQSILMLHHSHLETDATSHRFTQRFTLPAA
ncbi:TPA: HAMP domain-containing histidine kinase [Vibrio parahaemolyticus]|uniref:sensor histidine kinase n=1 Tax=Vibrio parahaemolyticus TaxID=670 RepID=UPI00186A47F9|nr:HAMP domain-containing sensor histidine kinase [Vibrio parahaemolyticus]EGQ8181282.1 HAMP domain-containing histidine kinase [Vibrio parahaemolyticus]MBE3947061.1 HAMP domain-containing histidine kinase [Vibrio parahaemolyticus]MBE4537524.1 HAMP domain-containing histidine kinase [Vibrio parahaemolyticus]MCZ6393631.1 HAMP domain-containing histidine kinase [Vibrio parahaemolyticus]HAS6606113.1 HAMP domain-containing protein [Vibrio parahaemolyticus]